MDFTRLINYWYQWAPTFGGGDVSVSTSCDDCEILFKSEDYSVHLRRGDGWWITDTVDDRRQRRNGAAKLSSFELTEKYLIWDWGTTAHSSLASGPLGTDLYRLGYAPGITVAQVDRGYEICSDSDRAILSAVDATIFSHLMAKSVDEIEQMVRDAVG
ncbi:hypothetical protein [[Mycobacterium] nativiensis]|uniref:Uncharacterized protein n=1 Tax=[Mycobacterium] nativiensis TaxID=2855503 RepID=A0ABU5XR19_9MYCO|nr:hypothetical protein [Mycolicibacter sp. MYC340]MEB3030385.1 hypothetical protein [Mycolicibacter sp. MYC340]